MLLNLLLWACDAPISSDTSKPKQEVVESPIHWTECSYYGEVIVLDVSAMWCGPCQEAAWNSNSIDVSSGGVKWITVLLENLDGEAPSVEDGQMWGDYFGIWHNEILLGSPENRDPEGISGFANTGWPYFLILDKDLMIRVVQQGWNKEEILQHIADLKSE